MPYQKINFCSKFAIKTLPCYCCKFWHWKSKVSPYIIWYVFGTLDDKIWTKLYCPKCITFWALWQQNWVFQNQFKQRVDAILQDVSVVKQLYNEKLVISDHYLPVFQKLWQSDMCNQVKSDTKCGRPDQYETLSR